MDKSAGFKSYVYVIQNKTNYKLYVGKTNYPKTRFKKHIKIAFGGKEIYLDFSAVHAAILKYGKDNFYYGILEECDSEDEAYDSETYWIKQFRSNNPNYGYNCNEGGRRAYRLNEESILKMKKRFEDPEFKAKSIAPLIKFREDNPGFTSSINKGNKYNVGKKRTDEEKENLSILNREQVSKIRNMFLTEKYDKNQLANLFNINVATIHNLLTYKTWNFTDLDLKENIMLNNKFYRSSNNYGPKINKNDVLNIRDLFYNKNISCEELCKKYNLSIFGIKKIIFFTTWKNVSTRSDYPKKNRNSGEKVSSSKLKEIDVENIILMYNSGKYTVKQISDIYNINVVTIRYIFNNKSWKRFLSTRPDLLEIINTIKLKKNS